MDKNRILNNKPIRLVVLAANAGGVACLAWAQANDVAVQSRISFPAAALATSSSSLSTVDMPVVARVHPYDPTGIVPAPAARIEYVVKRNGDKANT